MENKTRILLIEDNPGDARLIREMLGDTGEEEVGFELLWADSLQKGFELAGDSGQRLDAILLDLTLPDSSGFDTFAGVHKTLPGIPVVLLTGITDEELSVRAVRSGAQDYLVKDQINAQLLVRAIRYAIERKRSEEELRRAYGEVEQRVIERTAELNRANEQLKESEERYRMLFQGNQAVMLVIDPKTGRLVDANPAACTFYGYSYDEILTMKVTDINVLTSDLIADEMDNAVKKKKRYFNFRHRLANGEVRDVEVYSGGVSVGGKYLLHSIIHDITERRRTEKALQESEKRYKGLVETTSDMVWELDRNSVYTYVSPKVKDILGYEPHEVIGKTPYDHMTDEEAQRASLHMRELFDAGVPFYQLGSINIHKDGRRVVIETSGEPIFDADGLVTGYRGIDRDVTDRKNAEEELRRYTEEIEDLYNNAPCAYHSLDRNGFYIRVNNTELKWLGYSRSEMVGKTRFMDLLTSKSLENFQGHLVRFKQRGWATDLELELVRKDGTLLHVLVSASAVKDAEGHLVMIRSVMYDVTERRKTEELLVASEARYRTLFNDSPIALVETDGFDLKKYLENLKDSGVTNFVAYFNDNPGELAICTRMIKIVDANKAALELYELEEKTDMAWDMINDHLINFSEGMMAIFHEKASFEAEFDIITAKRNKRSVYFKWSVPPRYAETHERVLLSFMDITERKKAQQALLEKTGELDKFFSLALDLLCIADNQGYFRRLNVAWENVLGYGIAELEGSRFLDFVHPEDLSSTLAVMGELAAGYHVVSFVNRYRCKDGSYRWIEWSSAQAGKIIYAAARDITERIIFEEELKKAKETAEEATRVKSQFLANMSHEIRTPMNAVLGLSHLALKTYLTAKQRDYLNKIKSSSQILLALINDILDLSKIEAGKITIEKIPFSLDSLMNSVANMTALKAEEKGLALNFEISPETPLDLLGDPVRLGQVLVNLVGNAIKFTEKGHVVVTVKKDEPEVWPPGSVVLCFSVSDTGIGMTKEQQVKIFNPFTQADGSTTRKYGGTGLGLTISSHLVECMGGKIDLVSNPGTGSTFTFSIPLIAREADKEQKLFPELANMKALVVDANKADRGQIKNMLFSLSMNVIASLSAEHAIKILEKTNDRVDLILVSYNKKNAKDNKSVRLIKDYLGQGSEVPMVIVAPYGHEDMQWGADKPEIQGFLVKPVTRSALLNTVVEIFSKELEDAYLAGGEREIYNRLAGARALVVEDNAINREVAREMLEALGLIVEAVENGKKAVEKIAVTGRDLDVILMDIQMAEMDGIEATKAIRSKLKLKELPIIAMTAHAMDWERKKSLDAGMNDFLSKPVDPDKLREMLMRWVKPGTAVQPPAYRQKKVTGTQSPGAMPAIPGIDVKKALERLSGNRKLLMKLIADFCHDYAGVAAEIRQALAKGAIQEARKTVHTLKGLAANLSAVDVSAAIKDLEKELENEENACAPSSLDTLHRALRGLAEAMKPVISEEKSGPAVSAPDRPEEDTGEMEMTIQKAIEQMDSLLARNSLEARKFFTVLKKHVKRGVSQEPLDKMEKALSRMDFKDARRTLSAMAKTLKAGPP